VANFSNHRGRAESLERHRRALRRRPSAARVALPPPDYFERATLASFRLDGLTLTAADVAQALSRGGASRSARACRTTTARRVRNHVAILKHLERALHRGRLITAGDVLRWYTSVAGGLSAGAVDDQTAARVAHVVSRVNSPHLRLWPAVREVAAMHVSLLEDPFVPGFNGILARLLLRYHLGRCGLPPVVFDPDQDAGKLLDVKAFLPRLIELLEAELAGPGRK
jgi:hypothetical protein